MSEDADQEDKTEDPTERRIEQAIERGDVPKSAEIGTFFVLAAGTLALMITGTSGTRDFVGGMRAFLENAHQVPMDGRGMMGLMEFSMGRFFAIIAIPFIFALLAGIASGMIMHRPLFTFESLMPKMDRVSPMAGFKRIFGKEALVQFIKSLVKFALVGTLIVAVLWPERYRLDQILQLQRRGIGPGSAFHDRQRGLGRGLGLGLYPGPGGPGGFRRGLVLGAAGHPACPSISVGAGR